MTTLENYIKKSKGSGTLFVVATPIGNLEDISMRAVRVLREVQLIACEDTRHTRKILNKFEISTQLTSYYREKEHHKAGALLEQLQQGFDIALVSDAGTPAVSDPGAVLVQLARRAGIKIVAIPGPSALTTALSMAGLTESQFYFGGFPPPKKNQRRAFFKNLAALPCPLIFYEGPHRIAACLRDGLAIFGDREALVFRELTKIHEQCLSGSLSQLVTELSGKVRGELVIIIQGSEIKHEDKPDNLDELLRWHRDKMHSSLKDAVREIAGDLDLSRSLVYERALVIWKDKK